MSSVCELRTCALDRLISDFRSDFTAPRRGPPQKRGNSPFSGCGIGRGNPMHFWWTFKTRATPTTTTATTTLSYIARRTESRRLWSRFNENPTIWKQFDLPCHVNADFLREVAILAISSSRERIHLITIIPRDISLIAFRKWTFVLEI